MATINTAPAMKIPLRNDSHEKVCAFKYFVWYAFFVAPAIKQASAIRNVILQSSNLDTKKLGFRDTKLVITIYFSL